MEVDLPEFHRRIATFEAALTANSAIAPADRYAAFHNQDPYHQIPPSLLHSGHLASYALACGMIEPFDREQLTKPATYLVTVEGECRYVDETGTTVRFYLSSNPAARQKHPDVRDYVRIAPNSVCFLTLAPEFRLPAYLGARFNLLIRDVYRGLLVGTGPLVDPGFTGRLSIPIHNFTSREYYFRADEGLVYFEFTKLGWSNDPQSPPLPSWLPAPIDVQPPFPRSKTRRRTLDDYLTDATGGGPPASSIGAALHSTEKQVRQTSTLLRWFGIGGVVAAVGLVLTSWSLYISAQQFTAAAQAELRQERQKTNDRIELIELRLKNAGESTETGNSRPLEKRRRLGMPNAK